MRRFRRYERVSNKVITVQSPALTPRELMNLVSSDIEVNIKARAGYYGNGSEKYPIPRSMSIHRLSSMAPEFKKDDSDQIINPPPTVEEER